MLRVLLYFLGLVVILLVLRKLRLALRNLLGLPRVAFWGGARGESPRTPAIHGEMARDPVCGMFVSKELPHRLERDGETIYFCSRQCLERYVKNLRDG